MVEIKIDRKEYQKQYYKKHNEKHKEKSKQHYLKNRKKVIERTLKYKKDHPITPVKSKTYQLKAMYNISLEEYDSLLLKQRDCCAICGAHKSQSKRALSVDHNHATGKVRGLLCHKCNLGLGYFKDSKTILEKAIKYLDQIGEIW